MLKNGLPSPYLASFLDYLSTFSVAGATKITYFLIQISLYFCYQLFWSQTFELTKFLSRYFIWGDKPDRLRRGGFFRDSRTSAHRSGGSVQSGFVLSASKFMLRSKKKSLTLVTLFFQTRDDIITNNIFINLLI